VTKPVRFDAEAEDEIAAAAAWYEEKRGGLGVEFLDAVEEAEGRLAEAPQTFPLDARATAALAVRRCPVARFPYWLVFLDLEGEIRVLAAAHTRRRPGYWRSRP
jgi:toxin ParE1/3/4